jgi:FMN-dependent NADH-azoreductase
MKILQINSSVRGTASASTRLASSIVARLLRLDPKATLVVREATRQPILDEVALEALFTPADARSPEQAARTAIDDATIAEVQAAEVLVIGVPMYNFGVPVQLKAWIDAIAKAGVTFRYSASGPEGLLKGKKVFVALARGGLYRDTPADSQVPYLKSVLGFLGMSDIHFIHAEGLAMGEDVAAKAFAAAEAEIENLAL